MAKRGPGITLHQYITAAVILIAAIGIALTVYASQQRTQTQSEATGENRGSISHCNIGNGFAGGIELFDGPNQTYDQRVMCISLDINDGDSINNDPHLGNHEGGTANYYNIWNFNNKTDSLKVRANPFCIVEASIFKDPNYDILLEKYQIGAMTVNSVYVRSFNFPSSKRGTASSLKLRAWCDFTKYRD